MINLVVFVILISFDFKIKVILKSKDIKIIKL